MLYYRPMYSVVVIPPKGKKYVVKAMSSSRGGSDQPGHQPDADGIERTTGPESYNQNVQSLHRRTRLSQQSISCEKSCLYLCKGRGCGQRKGSLSRLRLGDQLHPFRFQRTDLDRYDNLIYFMNSEALHYFSKGKKTKEIVSTILKKKEG